MVNSKGKRASNSNSKTNDAAKLAQNEITASSSMKTNVEETGVVSETEDKEENATEEVKIVENGIEMEKNEVNAIEVEEKDEANATEEEENSEENVVEGEEDEENDENAAGEEKKEEKVEAESKGKTKKLGKKNIRKKVARGSSKEKSAKDKDKPESSTKDEANATEEKENVVEGEEDEIEEEENDENAAGEEKKEEKVEAESKGKTKKLGKKNRRKVERGSSKEKSAKDKDKPESSGAKKASKKVETMGMIFMCSSKTKNDCYRYGVLGLPSSKRDIVQKIYKGMRLFLFDVDLRLMYGIYKASGPGGYNIEPEAFKSAFPSQVRFTVLNDCLPVAEEKFKKVIKENYYTKNKFHCHLTSEQVQNLCKLFVAANKGPRSKKLVGSLRAETRTFVDRDRKRRRPLDEEKRSAYGGDRRYHEPPAIFERGDKKRRRALGEEKRSAFSRERQFHEPPAMFERADKKRRRVVGEEKRSAFRGERRALGGEKRSAFRGERRALGEEKRSAFRGERRALGEEKRPAFGGERRYHEPPAMYEREAFASPLAPLPRVPTLPLPAPAPSYAYERTLEVDPYGRDPLFERRGPQHSDLEQRRRDEIEYRDPYNSYRNPFLYRDPLYSAGLQPEYHRPAASTSSEYRLAGLPSEYRHAAVPVAPPEYNPGRSLYRY